jgi:hypothetical protein
MEFPTPLPHQFLLGLSVAVGWETERTAEGTIVWDNAYKILRLFLIGDEPWVVLQQTHDGPSRRKALEEPITTATRLKDIAAFLLLPDLPKKSSIIDSSST